MVRATKSVHCHPVVDPAVLCDDEHQFDAVIAAYEGQIIMMADWQEHQLERMNAWSTKGVCQ